MIILAALGILGCLVGSGVAIGYALGHSHGMAEQTSVEWDRVQRQQRRHKRCTPEPVRLRLLELPEPLYDYRHPVFFDQDGPTPA